MTVPCRLAWLVPFLIVCGEYDRRATLTAEGMMKPTRVLNNLTVVEQHITGEATAGARNRHKFSVKISGVTALLSSVTGALFSRCLDTLLIWQQRSRARRELSHLLSLDDRTLADIGVSRSQVKFEAGKRFWQPPGPVTYTSAPWRSSCEKEPCSPAPSLGEGR